MNAPRIHKGFTRKDLISVFRGNGFTSGAEIGVADGQFSLALCEGIPNLYLICVDSWVRYKACPWNRYQDKHDAAYVAAVNRMLPYNAILVKKFSMDAVKDVPINSLDFVYIDANHKFEFVLQDLKEWGKRVRVGGMIAGHDYYEFRKAGVMEAVNLYLEENNIEEWNLTDEREATYFWVKK